MPSEPKRKSWSNLPMRWPFRSMWKSLPCHSAWATAWVKLRPDIVSWANSGLTPTMSGHSSCSMKARAWPDGGQEHVAPRLVRLRLDGDDERVAALADVGAAQVDGLGVAVEGGAHVLGRLGLHALAPAPHDVDLGAQLGPEVDGVERLGHRVAAHVRVVGDERALLEDGLAEEVGRRHRHLHAGLVEGLAEALQDGLPLAVAGAEGHEVVVVEVDAVGAELGQPVHRVHRVERRPHLQAEGIPARVARRSTDRT